MSCNATPLCRKSSRRETPLVNVHTLPLHSGPASSVSAQPSSFSAIASSSYRASLQTSMTGASSPSFSTPLRGDRDREFPDNEHRSSPASCFRHLGERERRGGDVPEACFGALAPAEILALGPAFPKRMLWSTCDGTRLGDLDRSAAESSSLLSSAFSFCLTVSSSASLKCTAKAAATSSGSPLGMRRPEVLTSPFRSLLHSCIMQSPFAANKGTPA